MRNQKQAATDLSTLGKVMGQWQTWKQCSAHAAHEICTSLNHPCRHEADCTLHIH